MELIPLVLPLLAMSVGAVWLFGKTALGAAVVRQIEGRGAHDQDLDAIHDELDQVREQLTQLRSENAEVLERLDFTERLLSKGRSENPD